MAADYIELHAASAFSFLRGASLPEHLAERAAQLGLPALAVLDRDGLYGAPRVYSAAREQGIRPLVGAEVTLEDGSVLPLLVKNRTGYQNLCQLISTAKLEPREDRAGPPDALRHSGGTARPSTPALDPRARKRPCFATWAELAAHRDGLIALTGDEDGPLLRGWQHDGEAGAAAVIDRLSSVFDPGHLFVEIQRHRVRGEETAGRMLADLAAARRLPLLATGGVLHATREQRDIADVFTCLRHHTTLDAAGRLLSVNAGRHLRSGRRMHELFADHPEALANTLRLADRLDFTLENLGYEFPGFPVGPGETMEGVLRDRAYEGARRRFPAMTPRVIEQLDRELAVINKLKFPGYFLIVWDVCRRCQEKGILIQGRGSAANSAVCYALGITAVDPIAHELLFERFLSEGRVGADGHPSWPDIDLDLPSGDLRESVIQDVYTRYGRRGAAMVANVITFCGRSAAREVGKVLGLPDDVLDRFSSLYANGDFPHTLDLKAQFKTSGLPAAHPRLPALLSLCHRLKTLPRHLGQHSGGMILCPGRLDRVVPVENASMEGRTIVQWDKDDCEDLGLVKIDFLGLGMMAVLQECQKLCADNHRPFQLHQVPPDDPEVFDLMCRAETIGVFQIESRAQMATLPRLQPRKFYDVAIAVAIVRPGPITGGITAPIVERRGPPEKPFVCIDPSVDEKARRILGRTYGVILFQEQMLALAMELADFSGAEAEELRRALGFHRSHERLLRITARLRDALKQKGCPETVVQTLVEASATFALYGFPESHAISFALLAYASTWLKLHRPAEFYASLLNNQPMGFYSAATLVQDGRRRGLKVLPVCVQRSAWPCTVEGPNTIRIGLCYVKGLHENHARDLIARRSEQPFTALGDFLHRAPLSATERRALASVGALNVFAGHRRAALWQVEAAWSADDTLFHHAGTLLETEDNPLAPMTLGERVQEDFRGLSLTVGEHPMRLVRDQVPDLWCASDLPLGRDGEFVTIGGSVICRQRPGTAKGTVFISLEDETGVANAIVRSELFEQNRFVINEEPTLRIYGKLQRRAGVIHVRAEKISPLRLSAVPAQSSHDFH
ncbi:MAG: polymerase alpha subunit [Rariglobus sp.]|jgi:error-prone DNA polymerase|nr:polymerase alpha subunit [Rariglobus sp.]